MANNPHTGDPATYAGTFAPPASAAGTTSASITALTARVSAGLAADPNFVGLGSKPNGAGLDFTVTLKSNTGGVGDLWVADLAVGAAAELAHTNQAVINDYVQHAVAIGPGVDGLQVATQLGVGAVRLGQIFGSPSDATLIARVQQVAKSHGLTISKLQILHPLESALSVTLVVPSDARVDWTIDQLTAEMVGAPPVVEGAYIELDDPSGAALLQTASSYRVGHGALWFAPGQDARFGAAHGGTPAQ